jgi:hypothetical protein
VWTWPPFGEELYEHKDDPQEPPHLFDQLEVVNLLAVDGYDGAEEEGSQFEADDFDDHSKQGGGEEEEDTSHDNEGEDAGIGFQTKRKRVRGVKPHHRKVGKALFEQLRLLVLERRGVADEEFYRCDRIGNRSVGVVGEIVCGSRSSFFVCLFFLYVL